MKFFVNLLLIALLSFVAGLYLPDWVVAPTAFLVILLIPLKPFPAFLAGFSALFLLWGGLALAANASNGSILATRIAFLLQLNGSPYALILVTGLAGGLMGGGGALTASFLKKSQ
ncbi:MAG TPA: hypothetical protein VGR89_13140 [Puia sp.]|nr:hypothetical protein [Puia sp.]